MHLRTTWGRVGSTLQSKDKIVDEMEVQRLIGEKMAKGYQELDLHVPPAIAPAAPAPTAPALPGKVVTLLDMRCDNHRNENVR